jgi:hypothetical protein
MAAMTESFETMGKDLIETCLKDLSVYRLAVKKVQSPAIRKLVESIIVQKVDQLAGFKTIISNLGGASQSGSPPADISAEGWPDPESLLKAIVARENGCAESIRQLATLATLEEHREFLGASAERSRKFASWSQDHLDLLSLF